MRSRQAEVLAQPDLGQVSDGVIARRLGVARVTVLRARKSCNIQPIVDMHSMKSRHADILAQPDLGQVTDSEIAQRFGVSRAAVMRARHSKNTPCAKPGSELGRQFDAIGCLGLNESECDWLNKACEAHSMSLDVFLRSLIVAAMKKDKMR